MRPWCAPPASRALVPAPGGGARRLRLRRRGGGSLTRCRLYPDRLPQGVAPGGQTYNISTGVIRTSLVQMPRPSTSAGFLVRDESSEEYTQWGDMLKVYAGNLGMDEKVVMDRLDEILTFVPDLAPYVHQMDALKMAELLAHPAAMFQRLMELKKAFPACNVSGMVLGTELWLLQADTDLAAVAATAERFRAEFADADFDPDRLFESFPWLLNLRDQKHVRVPVVQLQRLFFEDHIGTEAEQHHLSELTVSNILAFKQKLVEEEGDSSVTDFDRYITRDGYAGDFRF